MQMERTTRQHKVQWTKRCIINVTFLRVSINIAESSCRWDAPSMFSRVSHRIPTLISATELNSTKRHLCATLLVTFVRTMSLSLPVFANLWSARVESVIFHDRHFPAIVIFGPSFSGPASSTPPMLTVCIKFSNRSRLWRPMMKFAVSPMGRSKPRNPVHP